MKNYIVVFLMLFIINKKCLSQQICFTIDSIKIYSLPFNMRTSLVLNEEAVRVFDMSDFKKINPTYDKKVKTINDINMFRLTYLGNTILFQS